MAFQAVGELILPWVCLIVAILDEFDSSLTK
jgi:hypothetical protein